MTQKLYDENAYLFEFESQVVSCTPSGESFEVILEKTAFFPEEGGQSADTGVISGARVLDVRNACGEIVHITDRPVSGKCACAVDFEPRLDKMRQHTGEHIACGTAHSLYGCENVGFHLGSSDVTFDLDLPFDRQKLDEIERQANLAVLSDLPVFSYYPDEKALAALDYRSKTEISGRVRIVEIKGIDVCACCAPHVSSTGQVGLIKFTDAYSYKGGTRIHLACGERAVYDCQLKQKNLETVAQALSAKTNEAARKFEQFYAQNLAIRARVGELSRELALLKAKAVPQSSGNIVLFERDCAGDTLRLIANALQGKYAGLCAVLSGEDGAGYSFVCTSERDDMQALAGLLRQRLGARCGGNGKMIQGTVNAPRPEIEKILNLDGEEQIPQS